jgi:hypothetical protein
VVDVNITVSRTTKIVWVTVFVDTNLVVTGWKTVTLVVAVKVVGTVTLTVTSFVAVEVIELIRVEVIDLVRVAVAYMVLLTVEICIPALPS